MAARVGLGFFLVVLAASGCGIDERSFDTGEPSACSGPGCETVAGGAAAAAAVGAAARNAAAIDAERGRMSGGDGSSDGVPSSGDEPSGGAPSSVDDESSSGDDSSSGDGPSGDDSGSDESSSGAGSPTNADATGGTEGAACGRQLLENPGFEPGEEGWSEVYVQWPVVATAQESQEEGVLPVAGSGLAWFGGIANERARLSQSVRLPPTTLAVLVTGYHRLRARRRVPGAEDRMSIDLVRGLDVVENVFAWTHEDATPDAPWVFFSRRLEAAAYAGTTITLQLENTTGDSLESNFFFDDLSLIAECAP